MGALGARGPDRLKARAKQQQGARTDLSKISSKGLEPLDVLKTVAQAAEFPVSQGVSLGKPGTWVEQVAGSEWLDADIFQRADHD
jgi:hypothetical protein